MSCRLIKHFVFAKCSLYKMRLIYKDNINMQKSLGCQLDPQVVDLAIRRKRNTKLQELNTIIIAVSKDMSKVEVENKEKEEQLLKVESEKIQEGKKLQEMENRFSALSQENSKLESECKDISEQLAKMKTKKVEE
jgi:hypothetical protein